MNQKAVIFCLEVVKTKCHDNFKTFSKICWVKKTLKMIIFCKMFRFLTNWHFPKKVSLKNSWPALIPPQRSVQFLHTLDTFHFSPLSSAFYFVHLPKRRQPKGKVCLELLKSITASLLTCHLFQMALNSVHYSLQVLWL